MEYSRYFAVPLQKSGCSTVKERLQQQRAALYTNRKNTLKALLLPFFRGLKPKAPSCNAIYN
jgi:hypothetical protein